MAKKKHQKSVNGTKGSGGATKRHMKKNVKELAIFLAILLVIGLVFMNFLFTLLLILGVLFILWLSSYLDVKKRKKWVRVTINCVAIFILLVSIAGIAGIAWFFSYVVKTSPEFNENAFQMSQTTKIFDANGTEIAEISAQKREIVTYEQISDVVIDALVATEDSRFFQHNGFDAPRFLVASIKQALGNKNAGGASTLTMQVAKNSLNEDISTVTEGFAGIARKFSDIYLAVFKIEKNYSKQEIIELYLNDHLLGGNAYGIEQAAQTYFGKHASEMNLAEASLIIGLYKGPNYYNPYLHPDRAAVRRYEVLDLMYRHGYISKEEKELANAVPISSLLTASTSQMAFQSFLSTVASECQEKYGIRPDNNSVLVYTTMIPEYQQVIDDIMNGNTYQWENPEVEAGIAVVEVDTGKVLAIGAGRNHKYSNSNYATQTRRQIGSTAKPIFDYGPGMEYLGWSTYTLFDDSKYYYTSGQEIRNSDRGYMGVITLREALAQSRNIPALKAFQANDNKKIMEFAQSLGVSLEQESINTNYLHEAYSIGSFNGSNPLEMAGAYAAFANGGYFIEPYTITKIIFRDTGEVITHEPEKKRVMSDATAFMITDVLKTAVNSGLSGAAKINGVNVAAKTGTTNYPASVLASNGLPNSAINDAWIIGYDPHICISIWYGYEPINRNYWTTANSAYTQRRGLFTAVGSKIFKKDGSDFTVPDSVIKVAVEKTNDINQSPKLPSEYTPESQIVYEYFRKGSEPTEVSTAYQRLPDATGLKVTYLETDLSVNLSWKAITPPKDLQESYGKLGYRIYKDGTYIGFTTETSYKITDMASPGGTYRVATSYENNQSLDSAGITYKLDYEEPKVPTENYQAILNNVPASKTYQVGSSLEPYDTKPSSSDVKVTKDGKTVTPTVSIAITDNSGNAVQSITTEEAKTYTITYTITYETYKTTLKRTVKVVQDTE